MNSQILECCCAKPGVTNTALDTEVACMYFKHAPLLPSVSKLWKRSTEGCGNCPRRSSSSFAVQKRICIKALSTEGLKSPLSNVLLLWLGLGWMPGKLSLLFRSHNREERLEQKTWDHECLRGNIGDP